MQTEYERFPEPEEIRSTDPKYTIGANKSKRSWKLGVNRNHNKCILSRGKT